MSDTSDPTHWKETENSVSLIYFLQIYFSTDLVFILILFCVTRCIFPLFLYLYNFGVFHPKNLAKKLHLALELQMAPFGTGFFIGCSLGRFKVEQLK
jgi:hypothetical protein